MISISVGDCEFNFIALGLKEGKREGDVFGAKTA